MEIKYGQMVFDSKLVIISTNDHPMCLASSFGTARDAMFRRFTDTCGAYLLNNSEYVRSDRFKITLCRFITRALDKPCLFRAMLRCIPRITVPLYSDLSFE